jgi:uncharacterized membrane protein
MKLSQKLSEWQEAGLIDAGTAARIAAHERIGTERERRPYLLYAVGGLGAFSVGIGLLSIVASNWEAIPAGVKLVLDFALLIGLAAGLLRVQTPPEGPASGTGHDGGDPQTPGPAGARRWLTDVLVFVFYGAVLASIGLVAQIYHLGGDVVDALLFWSLITAPIVLHGHGRLLALVWFVTIESVALALTARALDRSWHREEGVIVLTICSLLSLVLAALGQWGWFRERRPSFAGVAASLGIVQLALLATFMPLAWYERDHSTGAGSLGAICLIGVLAFSVGLAVRNPARSGPGGKPLLALAVVAPLLSYAPLLAEHDKSGFTAAVSYLVLWSLIGFAAYRLGHYRVLNLATALLGLRLLVIYFEVFGSLLDTGIGLLSGGLLTILLAWAWVKKSRQWSPPPASQGGDHDGGDPQTPAEGSR